MILWELAEESNSLINAATLLSLQARPLHFFFPSEEKAGEDIAKSAIKSDTSEKTSTEKPDYIASGIPETNSICNDDGQWKFKCVYQKFKKVTPFLHLHKLLQCLN